MQTPKEGTYYYGPIICMDCSKVCEIWEEVDIGGGNVELWCYCPDCDVETFHPPILIENDTNKI